MLVGCRKRSEAGGRGESETQSSTGEGKEAGFNCAGVLVPDAGNFVVEILEMSIALLY
ncbi:MAG: hypothetical protein JGK17_29760 [Microcoleus sp. PH2017_10_PVI_O_A]|uniref:hypothetical protein n=1 Tax=unclassified Microcoleus TaxID=2642155 RepID=UPI001D4734BA|nr:MULTISPECIES: hypothetical protein [unclassified Microcoleus]MCC3409663.1 hypothetical protein [Microcoleus sp. PH2017_10_PVI_O_A]MCC3481265.1 hypothetical protein [Microcoleus sp. PH2017_12_PCY_D_A]MCC3531293.1 hypothetical protein [Microcoleus sp. PH2017_21_RUC_O_A]MCC3543569.1 hypothetical protein [Microcoleus sp. PH2017_22_RUC_O_B]